MIRRTLLICVVVSGLLLGLINLAQAQDSGPQGVEGIQAVMGTAFTYQGQLKNNGSPVNDSCDFQLYLYDSLAGTGMIGPPVSRSSIQVMNGNFTITNLDFGGTAFNGDARWLRIDVRCPAGGGAYTTLTPRQPLTPAPYALALPGLRTQQNATSPSVIGGYSGNIISSTAAGSVIGGGGNGMDLNRVQASFATISGGAGNSARGYASTIGGGYYNEASGEGATIGGGGWNGAFAEGNQALAKASTIGGGYGNTISVTAQSATIGGGDHIRVSGQTATVAGGSWITVTGDYAAVIGGRRNIVAGDYATVGGGLDNAAESTYSTIAGGIGNTAHYPYAMVGGGSNNLAQGNHATVVGGAYNEAIADYAFIGGGSSNTASGYHSTIPGGSDNVAIGSYSFAAGHGAQANHGSTFVWADSTLANFASTANNQFLIRAEGGVGINTNSTYTNALTVNGRVIAGGTATGVAGGEPFVARGSSAGISLDDRAGGANPRWVIFPNDGTLNFWNGAPRLIIDGTGILYLGNVGTAGGTALCRNTLNQIANCSSSARYKNNIAASALGLHTVAQLRPVTFDWTSNGEHDLGFVAEEVDQVTPLLTTRNAEGQIEGVKYDRISAVLVKAVQEQQQQIAALQQQNAKLQARLADLDPATSTVSFNLFNLLSVLACGGMVFLVIKQFQAKRGEA